MSKLLNILFVARDDGGCGFFRCEQPAKFLGRSGLANALHVLRTPTPEQLMNADLVILQETGSTNSAQLIQFMLKNNIPFITEFDDFIHHISPHNAGGYGSWNPSTLFLNRAVEAMRHGVGMTVSTPQLAREYFPYNQMIYVVPNYLDKEKWDNPVTKRSDDKIRIGWCGGNAHADDLKMIAPVIDKIVKEYKGKVIFETMGMTRQELAGVFPMTPTPPEDVCPSCGFEGDLHHFPGEELANYPVVLASKGWDIAVAPVINNAFGNCKSDLKIKEYAAVGIPTVASPVVPYAEAVKDGAKVILADTFDEWYVALKSLIEDAEKRATLSRENKAWVEKYWIQDNIGKTFAAYKQIIDRVVPILGTREHRLKMQSSV